MKDRTLDIFMVALFGVGGVIILILAVSQPMPLPDKLLAVSIGSLGLGWALFRLIQLMPLRDKIGIGHKSQRLK